MGHGQKSGHGRKNVAHGKNGKMFFNVYFLIEMYMALMGSKQ